MEYAFFNVYVAQCAFYACDSGVESIFIVDYLDSWKYDTCYETVTWIFWFS